MRLFFPASVTAPSNLTVFALLYAWANLLHQLSFPEWIKAPHLIGWLLFLASGLLALRPSSWRLFLSTLVLRVAYTVEWMPMIREHLFLEGLFTVGILLALMLKARDLRRYSNFDHEQQESLYASFAPFLRAMGLVTYAAVTLCKINSEFIDPERSESVLLLQWTAALHPSVPSGPWANQAAIWGTFLFEGGIPVLLVFRRTRLAGLIAGLFFHTLLAFLPLRISSFTLVMYLLLYVWLPASSPRHFHAWFVGVARRLRIKPYTFALLFYLVAGTSGMMFAGRNGFNWDMQAVDLGIGMWWWQTLAALIAVWSIRQLAHEPARKLLRLNSWGVRLWLAFIVFNYACPYIGLKTRSALSMHSNLRTEKGHWNHLFLPEALRVFGYQDALITVVATDQPDFDAIRNEGFPLPYFEFARWCRRIEGDFHVVYRDEHGTARRFDMIKGRGSDAQIMKPHPLLEKFLCFNPIGAGYDYIPEALPHVGPSRNMIPRIRRRE